MYSISLYIGYECNLFGTVMLYAVVMIDDCVPGIPVLELNPGNNI